MAVLKEVAPSKGVSEGSLVKEKFTKPGLSEGEASKPALYFIDVRKSLHGDSSTD
ncbi:MAG: hypothetical protein RQ862_11490 [Candidatus Caldarchaeales archaeon]|jgi:hypothetical protein|nr:hypothetical protein [Candidatus Caldarchaeales archaeon]